MRVVAMVVSAMAMSAGPGAAQEAMVCAKDYGACMDRCATMGRSPMQDRCFVACQKANDACGAEIYGSWRASFDGPKDSADEALAREPNSPPASKPEPVVRPEPRVRP